MSTFTHSISTTVQFGHDWIPILAQIVAPVGSVLVAGAALLFSYRQGERTRDVAQHQLKNDEAKIRADLYDRRYEAWRESWNAGTVIYKAILNLPNDTQLEPKLWVDYDDAANKVFFLFNRDIIETVQQLRDDLFSMNIAKVGRDISNGTAQLTAMDKWIEALNRCDNSRSEFKMKTGKEIAIFTEEAPGA